MRALAVCAAVFLLAGCSSAESVDYYKSNKAERQAKLESCLVGPWQIDTKDQGCVNAFKAERAAAKESAERPRDDGGAGLRAGQAARDKAVADAMAKAKADAAGKQQ
jgi:hypothetical protein